MNSEQHTDPVEELTGFESEETPTEQVEDVVVALDEAYLQTRECHRNHHIQDPYNLEVLHDRICHTELKGLFESYEEHKILTTADLQQSITLVIEKLNEVSQEELPPDERTFLDQKRALIEHRGKEIDLAARRYVKTISKFFHIAKQKIRMSPEEFKPEFQRVDQLRRAAHDGLITTLTIYTKTINDLYEYGFLDDVIIEQWHTRDRFVSEEDVKGKVFTFAPEVLRNRELVKDWAISAHLASQLREIEEMQKGLSLE